MAGLILASMLIDVFTAKLKSMEVLFQWRVKMGKGLPFILRS